MIPALWLLLQIRLINCTAPGNASSPTPISLQPSNYWHVYHGVETSDISNALVGTATMELGQLSHFKLEPHRKQSDYYHLSPAMRYGRYGVMHANYRI